MDDHSDNLSLDRSLLFAEIVYPQTDDEATKFGLRNGNGAKSRESNSTNRRKNC